MTMFKRDKDLLVAIHDGQLEIGDRDADAFSQLLAQGLVSGAEIGGGRYEGVSLTVEGRLRIPAIIQRD